MQYSGDGADATDAELSLPQAVAADSNGNTYIADTQNAVVRRVDTTGKIETIAGNGVQGSTLSSPQGVAVNASGDVFIADAFVGRVYRVDASTHAITTYAGGGSPGDGVGDGGAATAAQLEQPRGLAVDAASDLYIADYDGGRVRRVDAATGHISTVAGGGSPVSGNGDGGAATARSSTAPRPSRSTRRVTCSSRRGHRTTYVKSTASPR